MKFEVHVIADRCKECGICIEVCPRQVLKMGNEINRYGYRYPIVVAEDRCIGCRNCEYHCPDFAIFVKKVE
ncbi:MAG: 2-oxoglutarate ferredoxin oxidoreductase subunit delta [Thermoprotei archaeon]|nr:MAG: 2-oxoglutarate ferredoxin oxidoreductase subunit delta [Thermoprotei archaeon]